MPGTQSNPDRLPGSFLEEAEASFDRLDRDVAGLDVSRATERAAAALAPWIAGLTGAAETWHDTLTAVLFWWIERRGLDSRASRRVVREVVSGHFASWCTPSTEVCAEAAAALGLAIEATEVEDALAAWRRARATAFGEVRDLPAELSIVRTDGHLAYVEAFDRPRGDERAEHMLAAISMARSSALRGEPLTLERLARFTGLALGHEARVRTTDAFAKDGRERYAHSPALARLFDEALGDVKRHRARPLVRAARVYLDVCFFHPFEDGNGRAARLALDHVLTSTGLALHAAGPVFALARGADDERGAWHLVALLALLVGERDAR
ncbi:MAG: Fic family protein [Sandaracinaceae bacterium]|nr:Fic family protein [Sandaracinaceae bacterium]